MRPLLYRLVVSWLWPVGHWLTAQPAHSIQSPYLYQLYTQVLDARVAPAERRRLRLRHRRRFSLLAYRLVLYYAVPSVQVSRPDADLLRCLSAAHVVPHEGAPICGDLSMLLPNGDELCLVDRPHRSAASHMQWQHLKQTYPVSIDMGYAGILLSTCRLARQHLHLQ